jgi:thiol-disulfide isomerase/thioredoxin
MGKASRTKQSSTRQERIAAQRAAAKRSERRRRLLTAGGSVLAVLAIVAGFVIYKATQHNSSNEGVGGPTGGSLSSVISKVTSVPAATLASVGGTSGVVKPQSIQGNPPLLTSGGKPEMLYMGAEYCPYCAAERWSMIVALSRFGTFSGLQTMRSSGSDIYPNTPTWTFLNSSYSSPYLNFTAVEMQDRNHANLQTPTSAENALITKYDAPPYVSAQAVGSIPFIDFGNRYLIIGASYSPQTLAGLTWAQVAADLSNPNSPVAKGVDGTANYMTAALCKLTGNKPANVCTSAIQSLEGRI